MDIRKKEFGQLQCLRPVILRSINKNQVLILNSVKARPFYSITRLLTELSEESGLPLSTLKINSKELAELGLLETGNFEARLTELGIMVLKIIGEKNGKDE